MSKRFLRLPEVEQLTGYKRSSIYRLAKDGEFPSPIRLGGRASAWLEHEVQEWMAERIRVSRSSGV